ncbi:MAG: hypothetical protein AAF417_18780, partial [Pseudomonadota bacterium]
AEAMLAEIRMLMVTTLLRRFVPEPLVGDFSSMLYGTLSQLGRRAIRLEKSPTKGSGTNRRNKVVTMSIRISASIASAVLWMSVVSVVFGAAAQATLEISAKSLQRQQTYVNSVVLRNSTAVDGLLADHVTT